LVITTEPTINKTLKVIAQ